MGGGISEFYGFLEDEKGIFLVFLSELELEGIGVDNHF